MRFGKKLQAPFACLRRNAAYLWNDQISSAVLGDDPWGKAADAQDQKLPA